MRRMTWFWVVLCLGLISCSPGASMTKTPEPAKTATGLKFAVQSGQVSFYCCEADIPVVTELKSVMDEWMPKICRNLRHEDSFPVSVEVYPDQSDYDGHLIDKSVVGSPACSGSRRIAGFPVKPHQGERHHP